VALVLTLLAAVGLSIGYTATSQHRSDRQWCEILRSLDQPLPSGSPVPDRTRRFAAEVHRLRVGKGC